MSQKSKVYIIQNVVRKYPDGTFRGLDYSQAERFGEIIYLFDGNKQVVMSPQPTIRKLKTTLKDFNDSDYLLLVGDPALIGLTTSVLVTICNGRYNMLKYDRIEKDYFPIRVDVYN
jgi:hypothetical protein|tara:strand:- start:844 stop:1191 length:348 start_codon:yes stop_codon:yes gene_type:complete